MPSEEEIELMHKLNNNSQTNPYELVEMITKEFCEEQLLDERNYVENLRGYFTMTCMKVSSAQYQYSFTHY